MFSQWSGHTRSAKVWLSNIFEKSGHICFVDYLLLEKISFSNSLAKAIKFDPNLIKRMLNLEDGFGNPLLENDGKYFLLDQKKYISLEPLAAAIRG